MTKTNNIFDRMDKDIDELDEKTVIEETGVSADRVREIFMNKINNEAAAPAVKNSGKKGSRKKVFVILAAAAAATIAAGTITAGAMGSFNAAFGEHFAGERVNGIYSGSDIKIETADAYKAELLGITGDRNSVYASVSYKRADGGKFVENADGWYVQANLNTASYKVPEALSSGSVEEYDVDYSAIQQMQGGTGDSYKFSTYTLSSEDTIKGIYHVERDDHETIGQTMTVNVEDLYLLHDIEELHSYTVTWDENLDTDIFVREGTKADEIISEAEKDLKDGQVILRHDSGYFDENGNAVITIAFTLTEYEKLDVDMDGSWKLNYKAEEIKQEIKDETYSLNDIEYKISEIETGALNMKVTLEVTGGNTSALSEENGMSIFASTVIAAKGSRITLKTGEEIDTKMVLFCETDGNKVTATVQYFMNNDWISVNPEEIESVTLAGNEVTK